MTDFKSINGVTYQLLPQSELDVIEINNQFCHAIISLQGAQILKFQSKTQTAHQDLLWLSKINQYQSGKAIRGGIPLCFPWFGGHKTHAKYPAHGFARYLPWQLFDVKFSEHLGHELVFRLKDTDHTRTFWNHAFLLQMTISCQKQLKLSLEILNTGDTCFEYEFAWHSYFPVDIHKTQIKGLYKATYIDQLQNMKTAIQTEEVIQIEQEIDRIYPKTEGEFEIVSADNPIIYVKSTALSTVVWNPWIDKAQRLADVENQAWQDFVCVESGQIKDASIQLAPHTAMSYELIVSHI